MKKLKVFDIWLRPHTGRPITFTQAVAIYNVKVNKK